MQIHLRDKHPKPKKKDLVPRALSGCRRMQSWQVMAAIIRRRQGDCSEYNYLGTYDLVTTRTRCMTRRMRHVLGNRSHPLVRPWVQRSSPCDDSAVEPITEWSEGRPRARCSGTGPELQLRTSLPQPFSTHAARSSTHSNKSHSNADSHRPTSTCIHTCVHAYTPLAHTPARHLRPRRSTKSALYFPLGDVDSSDSGDAGDVGDW